MVLEYNSQKPFLSSSSNCVSPKLNDDNGSRSLVFFTCWKPLSTSNGFGVQLTETISTAKWFWHSGTVMMMNDGVDDEIEDSGNHFHIKMGLEYNSQKPFPQQNGFGIPVRWRWWTTMLMMRLKIPVVMMMNDGDDSVCFRVWFVLFGFFWGCRKQLCWDLCTVHKDFPMHHNRSPT